MIVSSKVSNSQSGYGYHFPNKHQEERFEGFDFLRAIFSVAIVALKTNLFLVAEILISGSFAYALMAKVAYLAVPVFLQISLFLFYLKSHKFGFFSYLQKRLPRLISLYLFWVIAKVIFDLIVFKQTEQIQSAIASPKRLIEFIISGAHSPFFFFFSLIFLTTLAAAFSVVFKKFQQGSTKLAVKYCLLLASCFLVFALSMTEITVNHLSNSPPTWVRSISSLAFWDYNPLCFLPYLFTTAIAAQDFNEGRLRKGTLPFNFRIYTLLFLSIFFAVLEWHFFEKLLHYSRLSLVFGSWLLLNLSLSNTRKPPTLIKFLSSCSLGIYGFHVFTDYFLSAENNAFLRDTFKTFPGVEVVVGFVLVLTSSIILTLIFKRVKVLKNYV